MHIGVKVRLPFAAIASLLLLALDASAISPDTVRPHLIGARAIAKKWAADARFVYLQSNSGVGLDGGAQCGEKPEQGWSFTFHSKKMKSYFRVGVCGNISNSKQSKGGFATPPESIRGEFIDTDAVGDRLRELEKDWGLSKCYMNLQLRMSGVEPEVDRNFPKHVPIWSIILGCDEDMGGFIFLNALNGKILQANKADMKGD